VRAPVVGDTWGSLTLAQRDAIPGGSLMELTDGRWAVKDATGTGWFERGEREISPGTAWTLTRVGAEVVTLGPVVLPAPDRSRWPVLVRTGRDFNWPSGRYAIIEQRPHRFDAWGDAPWRRVGTGFGSAVDAALAIHARLPDDLPESATEQMLTSDPRDAEIVRLRAEIDTIGTTLTDAECPACDSRAGGVRWLLRKAENAEADASDLRAAMRVKQEPERLTVDERTASPNLLAFLRLLDLAADKNEALGVISAGIRREVGA
jgi:hypothetical protein